MSDINIFSDVLTDTENTELFVTMRRAYKKARKLWDYNSERGFYDKGDMSGLCADFNTVQVELNKAQPHPAR